jgi:hypothetical protein
MKTATLVVLFFAMCVTGQEHQGEQVEAQQQRFEAEEAEARALLVSLLHPVKPEAFFGDTFQKNVLYIPGSKKGARASSALLAQDPLLADLHTDVEALDNFHTNNFQKYANVSGALTLRDANGLSVALASSWEEQRERFYGEGMSLVYKREKLKEETGFSRALERLFDTEISSHAYISGPGAQALAPHTDPYDVLVVHTFGRKLWRVCVPKPAKGTAEHNPAQLAELQEIEMDKFEGCTNYLLADLEAMACETLSMEAGDVLYLPKGIVHYATTDADTTGSAHVTYGLKRAGHRWIDLALAVCKYELEEDCSLLKSSLAAVSTMGMTGGLAWLQLATAAGAAVDTNEVHAACEVIDDLVLATHEEILSAEVVSEESVFSIIAG